MIKVYDDIIPSKLVDEIYDIMTKGNFPWYKPVGGFHAVSEKTQKKYEHDINVVNSSQLVHRFIGPGAQIANSPWTDIPIVLVENFIANANEKKDAGIIRSKANLLIKSNSINPKEHNPPHIDIDIPHDVLLYYVNDSDGDTIIFEDESGDKILERVTPKKGRLLYFSGTYYHCSSPPRNHEFRMVVNIDIES